MPFLLQYRMSSGAATRLATSVEEAVIACSNIQKAGGSVVDITDQQGKRYAIEELVAAARTSRPN